jgi:single-stranded-DNA-specific exonuclease
MVWKTADFDRAAAFSIERTLNCHRVVAEFLAVSGITDSEEAVRFLNPRLADLEDPFQIPNLAVAAERILEAMETGRSITLIGDYDVDGVTSTALLVHFLRRLGGKISYFVPRRLEEGYGLSSAAIERAIEGGKPDLMLALDCGTNSVDEVAHLRSLGIEVIILDHHRSKEAVPADCILVNPHVHVAPDESGKILCTVGLAFKLAHAMLKILRRAHRADVEQIRLRDYLDLVAMGSLADLVPLRGENRILCRAGLSLLETNPRVGVAALMRVSSLNPTHGVRPVDVSFKLGPRINAAGRLADASIAVDLFLTEDPGYAESIARELDRLNHDRQEIERGMVESVDQLVGASVESASGLVIFDEQWHPGVVGIVASRVSRKYYRPSIVLGLDGDLAKGSGRSVAGLNLVSILSSVSDLLESWGGHPMAVGVSLRKENVPAFQKAFNEVVRMHLGSNQPEPELLVHSWISPEEFNEELMHDIDRLHPFGEGNREPLFGLRGVCLRQAPEVFKEQHFRFQIEDRNHRRIFGVAWKMADRLPPAQTPIDLAAYLKWNVFGGRRFLQIELVDWRPASPTGG